MSCANTFRHSFDRLLICCLLLRNFCCLLLCRPEFARIKAAFEVSGLVFGHVSQTLVGYDGSVEQKGPPKKKKKLTN